jgi:hypothetical protein
VLNLVFEVAGFLRIFISCGSGGAEVEVEAEAEAEEDMA